MGDVGKNPHSRRRVLFKVQGKISSPSDRTDQRNGGILAARHTTLSGESMSPSKTNDNISYNESLEMSPEKDEIVNIVQNKDAKENEDKA